MISLTTDRKKCTRHSAKCTIDIWGSASSLSCRHLQKIVSGTQHLATGLSKASQCRGSVMHHFPIWPAAHFASWPKPRRNCSNVFHFEHFSAKSAKKLARMPLIVNSVCLMFQQCLGNGEHKKLLRDHFCDCWPSLHLAVRVFVFIRIDSSKGIKSASSAFVALFLTIVAFFVSCSSPLFFALTLIFSVEAYLPQ